MHDGPDLYCDPVWVLYLAYDTKLDEKVIVKKLGILSKALGVN